MKQTFFAFLTVVAISGLAGAAAKSLQVKDLPAAVQKTVQEHAEGRRDQEHLEGSRKGCDPVRSRDHA